MVEEALTNSEVMDRPKHPPNHLLPDSTSFTVANGEVWKQQRRFTIQTLRVLGMGKQGMESLFQEELGRLCDEIDSHGGSPLNLSALLMSSVSNNIFALLTGRRLDYRQPDRLLLNGALSTIVLYARPTRLHAFFPSARKWMARLGIWGYHGVEARMRELSKFIDKEIEKRKTSTDSNSPKNYIDEYLRRRKKDSTFTDRMLRGNFQSLFGAGSTPTRATIEWALVSMVQHPDVQRGVHAELDSVIGRERLPAWADLRVLPFTTAVLYEVMRTHSIIPISMLRTNRSRCKIGGYDIPRGTIIMTNIWGVHHDPKLWTDPEVFRPERFLKGGKAVKPTGFIPFSMGRRNCPGEEMGVMEAFLYFTTLMQRYIVCSPEEKKLVYKPLLGMTNMAILNNICMEIRE